MWRSSVFLVLQNQVVYGYNRSFLHMNHYVDTKLLELLSDTECTFHNFLKRDQLSPFLDHKNFVWATDLHERKLDYWKTMLTANVRQHIFDLYWYNTEHWYLLRFYQTMQNLSDYLIYLHLHFDYDLVLTQVIKQGIRWLHFLVKLVESYNRCEPWYLGWYVHGRR